MSQQLAMMLTSTATNNGSQAAKAGKQPDGKDDEFAKIFKKDLEKNERSSEKSSKQDEQKNSLSEADLEKLIADLNKLLESVGMQGESQAEDGELLPLDGQQRSLDEMAEMLATLPPNQLNEVLKKLPASAELLQNRFFAQSYFAQMNNPYGQSASAALMNVDAEVQKSDQQLLDSGLGIKALQHDRLINVAVAMRQELASERRGLDSQQQQALDQLDSMLMDEGGDPSLNHFANTNSVPVGQAQTANSAINLPVNHPRWGNALSEKVMWMMNSQIKEAEIKLNPGNLGSVEIKLSMQDDQANVSFNVQSNQAKEALEVALPRLREMLAEMGIALNDTDVSDQSASKNQDQQSARSAIDDGAVVGEELVESDSISGVSHVSVQNGLDLYI